MTDTTPGAGDSAKGDGPQGSAAVLEEVPEDEAFETGGAWALAGRTGWAIVGELANLVALAVVFKVLSDNLIPEDYGAFQAVVAIAVIAGPLATFGANWMLIRRAVVSTNIRHEVGRAIAISGIGTFGAVVLLGAIALAVPSLLSDISRVTMVLVLVAQMPALWMTELAVTAAVANADLKLAAKMRVVAAGIRIAVLLAFVVTVVPSVDSWAWFFAVGNVVAALASYWLLAGSLGGFPRPSLPRWREFVTGFPYGVGNTTEGVLAASDRPLLAQYNFGYESGIYAAGYRIVSLGFMPLRSLLKAQDRRFFRQGSFGSNASHRAGVAMSIHGLVTTVPVTAALWLGAPYLDLVISDAYAESETVIRFLALLPVIKGFQYAFGNALTAAGNQQARMWLTGAAALGNFVGNLWLIPSGGWRAAATTTLVAEIGLAVGFAIASLVYARIDRD